MIEVDLQGIIADSLNDFRNAGIDAVVADVLVLKGRQHEHATTAQFGGMCRKANGIGQRAASGAGHHAFRIDSGVDQSNEELDFLIDRQRIGFTVRAEHGEADVL